MISSVCPHLQRPILPPHASTCQRDPLSPTEPMAATWPQMTPPIILKAMFSTEVSRLYPTDRAYQGAIISPGTERPW